MARRLVVEGEAVAGVADGDDPPACVEPAERRRRRCARRSRLGVRRPQRVRANTCLMSVRISSWCCCSWLSPSSIRRRVSSSSALVGEQVAARRSSTWRAVGIHLGDRRPREQPPLRPRACRAPDGLVVRVEQVAVGGVERAVARLVRREHERLEEPGGVGQVPLRGAGVGHRLHHLVFGTQRFGQRVGDRTHRWKRVKSRRRQQWGVRWSRV